MLLSIEATLRLHCSVYSSRAEEEHRPASQRFGTVLRHTRAQRGVLFTGAASLARGLFV